MKLYIRSIILAGFLSVCSILFLSSNCSAALISNNGLTAASTAVSSPKLITPQDTGLTIFKTSGKSGSVVSQDGFFFYSNNPEYVSDSDLADNGCWLNQAEVSGNGQVYVWHYNAAYKTINSELNITNPNNESIIIESNQYGLTNGLYATDVGAWDSYLSSSQTGISILVEPGQSIQLFKQSVAQNNNFGIVAALNITDLDGNPAKALIEDIAYYQNVWKVKPAEYDVSNRSRGLGSSYKSTITFDLSTMTKNNYFSYSIGASNDSLNGKDLMKIKDNDNNSESLLAGNYGEVMTINIPIKNRYKKDQNFGIFIGSLGGDSYPFVKLDQTSFVPSPVKPFSAYDMIETGKMQMGSTETVSFTLVIPALSSTPLIIGVHPIE